jgi:RNA polymerase sigma-32 factor
MLLRILKEVLAVKNMSLPILSSEAGLIRYLDEIKQFPMLSEEEEKSLALRWYNDKDIDAAQKLVTSHMRLVAKLAMQYRGYGLPIMDLISEGNVGLMIAVKKFDPNKGFRLSTYALWWIKATIQDYILKSWSLVKIGTSAAHKKLFFNLRKIKSKLLNENQGQVPYNESELIAKELDVTKEDVVDLNLRFSDHESSLNNPIYNEEEGELIELVAEQGDNQEVQILEAQDMEYRMSKFNNALATLNEREQDIIRERKLKELPTTLDVLSKKYGVSTERVRQIEERAMQKLKLAVAE